MRTDRPRPLRHRRTLGFGIKLIVFGAIALTALVFVIGNEALRRADARYAELGQRDQAIERDVAGVLTAMLNQEVGLRAYLATGDLAFLEPYEYGKNQERALIASLGVTTVLDLALSPMVRRVAADVERWHQDIARPHILERGRGPIADLAGRLRAGKRAFDVLRADHAALTTAVQVERARAQAARDQLLDWIRTGMFSAAALVVALAIAATLHHVRRITQPLIALAHRAERAEGFPAPADAETVHEAYALAASLHRLDGEVAQRAAELEQARDESLALARFGELVQQMPHEDELHAVIDRACHAVAAPVATTILVASHGRLEIARASHRPDPRIRLAILDEPQRCRAARSMREVAVASDDPTACDCSLVPARGAALCVPMLAAGELTGVVNLQADARDHFTPRRIAAVQSYVRFAGGALGSRRMIAATRERALRDGLTGVHNRMFLDEYLPQAVAAAERHGRQVAVVLADLDHFKRINDEHGHPAGDQALVAFARAVGHELRASDELVRYGGEEFAIVLTDVTPDGALATAERIRAAAERIDVVAGGVALGQIVRVSLGVALFPEHGAAPAALIQAADAALYAAKQQGRNRVVLASAPRPAGGLSRAPLASLAITRVS